LFTVYLVVFGAFACLFPLAFYCLMLASWNGRRRAMVINGSADFAGVLLATSGFIIAGGPLILTLAYAKSQRMVDYPNFVAAWSAQGGPTWPWLFAWVGSFVLIVGGTAWLLIRRRVVTVIYNIHPADAQALIPETLQRLGMPVVQRGAGFVIELDSGRGVLDITIAPVLRHVTLRWSLLSGDVRQRFEAEMCGLLVELESTSNPAAGWFLTAATGLFSLLLVLLAMFVFQMWRLRH
jgi:hypothetical protein